jgi:hypothetical protein
MTVASESSNTQSASVGTEHTLATPSSAKTRVLAVDLNALVAADVVELRIKAKVTSGGTERLAYLAVFAGPVTELTVFSPPVPMVYGGTFTLKQTAGTGRSFPWEILTLD